MLAFVLLLLEEDFRGEAKHKTEKEVNAKRTTFCQISSKNIIHKPSSSCWDEARWRSPKERSPAAAERERRNWQRPRRREGWVRFFYLFPLLSSASSSRERVEGKSIVWFWFSSFCAYYALPCDWRRLLSLSLSNALLSDKSFVLCSAGGEGGVTHEGLTIHPAAPVHKILGTAMGGLMWFWVMYRFYHDGETLIYGHEPHFLHDDHHDDDEDGHKKHW